MSIIRWGGLFLIIVCAEALQISVFRYGNIVIALLLFLVFFFDQRTALASAFFAGFLEDVIAGPFGFHSMTYPFLSFGANIVCSTLLTNKSFFAFFLLSIAGFFSFAFLQILAFFFQETIWRGSEFFHIFFSFLYAREMLYGFFIQTALILALYGIQYRGMRATRAYFLSS